MAKQRNDRAPNQRQLRVGELIRHTLAQILEGGELHQPVLQQTPVTITEVRVSPDLRNATVFATPLGGGDPTPMLEALQRAKPYLRRRIAAACRSMAGLLSTSRLASHRPRRLDGSAG